MDPYNMLYVLFSRKYCDTPYLSQLCHIKEYMWLIYGKWHFRCQEQWADERKVLLGSCYLIEKSLVDIVDFRTIPNTDCAYAIEITCGNNMLLCVNMYMPVDNQRNIYVDTDMMDTIESTELLLKIQALQE